MRVPRGAVRACAAATMTIAALLCAAGGAHAKTKWLCAPGVANDPCRPSLSTTIFRGWSQQVGTATPARRESADVACFYVYPTVSNQQTRLATKAVDPELRSIALYQAARYSQHCRVYAPVYRQATVSALTSGRTTASDYRKAYRDVAEAFGDFLERIGRGRGFVLLSHSQGTYHLQRLVRARIDRDRSLRRRLVSAVLLGGNVTVRRGSDRGGVFRNVRACRRATQLGCVIAFSAFNETPPEAAVFGRGAARVAEFLDLPHGDDFEALCTNPADLGSTRSAALRSIAPTAPFAPGTLIAAGISILGLEYPTASTTWLESRGAFTGRCSKAGGASVLRIASAPGTPVPRPSPNANWGLHLIDANVALGDLVKVVGRQIDTFERR
jgi:hypothetical protein